jgi:glyoxylase-like metal-dependent hydrolase (beta-lactamase superfamily II)
MTTARISQVAPRIHEVFLPLPMRPSIVNVWLIDGGSEWALVDTGMRTEESMAAFQEALSILGIEPTAIGKIISTHHHPDHFGTSQPFRDLCQAEVYLHALEVGRTHTLLPRPRSSGAVEFFHRHGLPLERFTGVPSPGEFWRDKYVPATPDHEPEDGSEITVGDQTLQTIWTPGHAPGHCCFYVAQSRTLIVGDHLLPRISPHVGIFPDGPQNPLGDYLESLDKVARLDVDLVLPAHGGVYHDHRHRVEQLKQHHEYRMLAAVDATRATARHAYDIAQEIFDFSGDAPPQVQFPATFEALAHLELLVRRGRLSRLDGDDEVTRYRAT